MELKFKKRFTGIYKVFTAEGTFLGEVVKMGNEWQMFDQNNDRIWGSEGKTRTESVMAAIKIQEKAAAASVGVEESFELTDDDLFDTDIDEGSFEDLDLTDDELEELGDLEIEPDEDDDFWILTDDDTGDDGRIQHLTNRGGKINFQVEKGDLVAYDDGSVFKRFSVIPQSNNKGIEIPQPPGEDEQLQPVNSVNRAMYELREGGTVWIQDVEVKDLVEERLREMDINFITHSVSEPGPDIKFCIFQVTEEVL